MKRATRQSLILYAEQELKHDAEDRGSVYDLDARADAEAAMAAHDAYMEHLAAQQEREAYEEAMGSYDYGYDGWGRYEEPATYYASEFD